MRSRVNILQPNNSKDGVGTPIVNFTTLAVVAAAVNWKGGDEVEKETRPTAIINTEFEIWYRSDLTKRHVINFRNKIFNILSILQIGRKHRLKLITQQVELKSVELTSGTAWTTGDNIWIDSDGNGWVW